MVQCQKPNKKQRQQRKLSEDTNSEEEKAWRLEWWFMGEAKINCLFKKSRKVWDKDFGGEYEK